jgi:hypothetical protein
VAATVPANVQGAVTNKRERERKAANTFRRIGLQSILTPFHAEERFIAAGCTQNPEGFTMWLIGIC